MLRERIGYWETALAFDDPQILLEAGVSLHTVQALLGHGHIDTTMISISPTAASRTAARLWRACATTLLVRQKRPSQRTIAANVIDPLRRFLPAHVSLEGPHQRRRPRVETIPGAEFVARYLRHVLPRGLRAIRYHGNCHPAANLKRERIAFHSGMPLLIGAVTNHVLHDRIHSDSQHQIRPHQSHPTIQTKGSCCHWVQLTRCSRLRAQCGIKYSRLAAWIAASKARPPKLNGGSPAFLIAQVYDALDGSSLEVHLHNRSVHWGPGHEIPQFPAMPSLGQGPALIHF